MYRSPTESDAAPLHPGEVLRVDILPCLSMAPAELAAHIDVPRAVLDELLAERTRMTPDLAKRLGVALGQGAHYWLALQLQFDLWQAAQTELDRVRPVTWGRGMRRARSQSSAQPAAGRPLFGT